MVNCEKLLTSHQAADMKEFNSEPSVKELSPRLLLSVCFGWLSWWITLYEEGETLRVALPASTPQPHSTFLKALNTISMLMEHSPYDTRPCKF